MNNQALRYSQAFAATAGSTLSTCWYCDHPIVKGCRFCDKSCAEAFEDDELAVERRVLARQSELRAGFV